MARSNHRVYNIWNNMRHRCSNKKAKGYKHYGGRGIKVCERWNIFENFVLDMYPSFKEGLVLDRIDVNGNYELDNCRWVTPSKSSKNRRDKAEYQSDVDGVTWEKNSKKWKATFNLGYFKTEEEAIRSLGNLKNKSKIYLAGAMGGLSVVEANSWRKRCEIELANNYKLLNPISMQLESDPKFVFSSKEPNLTGQQVTVKDRYFIDQSEFILVNLSDPKSVSVGSVWEMGYAYAKGKNIITVCPKGTKFYDGHPFISNFSHVIFDNLEDAITFLNDIAV